MDLLKEIGSILGFVAFGGLAVLVFMTFQQARHVRRLREWAGRSPERSAIEAERVAEAAQEASIARAGGDAGAVSDELDALEEPEGPGFFERLRGEMAYRWEELDRRSPVDAKILVGALVAVIVGIGVVTSGFGLLGGSSDEPATTTQSGKGGGKNGGGGGDEDPVTKVAVLNGTAPEGGVGIPGVAQAASSLVEEAGFKVGNVTDASSPFTVSVVMYTDGFEDDAQKLADDLADQLGTTEIQPIDPAVEADAGRADLVLVVGQDDAAIAQ